MSILETVLLSSSIIISTIIVFYHCLTNRKWLLLLIYAICIGFLVFIFNVFFDFPSFETELVSKGENSSELPFFITLYIFIIIGMASQYFYSLLSVNKSKRESFDFGLLVAPIFTSPIIVFPLYSSFTDAYSVIDPISKQSIMIYIVAFQNGFFWKDFIHKLIQSNVRKKNEPKI